MKKYDLKDILEVWSTGNLSTNDPLPAPEGSPEDVENLVGNDNGPSGTGTEINNFTQGPTDPQNIPGADRTKVVKEAPGDPVSTTSPATPPKPKPPKTPSMATPDMKVSSGSMGGDPSMSGMDPSMAGGDPSMMGMGMETPGPSTTQEVGRVYELKKIYSRLVSMQSYLAGTTDINLIKLRNYVSNTMDLFRTLISNIALYKDRIDEIIVIFYKVVDNVYMILSKYYKDNNTGRMVKAVE